MSRISNQSDASKYTNAVKAAAEQATRLITPASGDSAKIKSSLVGSGVQVIKSAGAGVDLSWKFEGPQSPLGDKAKNEVIDPSRLAGKQLGGVVSLLLPGGVAVSNDPSKRPDLAGLGRGALIDSVRGGGALSALIGQAAGNRLGTGKVQDSATNSRPGAGSVTSFMDAEMADFKAANGGNATGKDRSHYMDEPAAAAPAEKKTEEKGFWDTITDALAGAGKAVAEFAAGAVFDKFGPPGPWSTPLSAPSVVEKVTGDSKDLVNGVKAVAGSGDKNADMKKVLKDIDDLNAPNPEGDVKLAPQQQAAINQLLGLMGNQPKRPTFGEQGTGLISQPDPDRVPLPKRDRETLVSTDGVMRSNSNVINPGSGDDGSTIGTGSGTPTETPTERPGVKDPPKPGFGGRSNPPGSGGVR